MTYDIGDLVKIPNGEGIFVNAIVKEAYRNKKKYSLVHSVPNLKAAWWDAKDLTLVRRGHYRHIRKR